ncbi:MAG TPA: hypothetical protein VG602_02490 [Actinomycetota bacterium]|nr:hypothetical protein [Actinomycetota bacterium]
MRDLPVEAREILDRGTLCYLGAPSSLGPHVTPVVFVLERGRVWGTTGRRTTKARRWRSDPVAGGLVRLGERAVAFRGAVSQYDALQPGTWPASVFRAPSLTLASLRFSRKNARFFAGYARDVTRVPLAWTPPARVIFSVNLDDGAVLDGSGIRDRWGRWGEDPPGRTKPHPTAVTRHAAPLDEAQIPDDMRALLGPQGEGVIGLAGPRGPVVLPATWARDGDGFLAVVNEPVLALAEAGTSTRAGLVVDRASRWRAAHMSGVLLRGDAHITERGVHLRPDTAVWWRGWASGTVGRP